MVSLINSSKVANCSKPNFLLDNNFSNPHMPDPYSIMGTTWKWYIFFKSHTSNWIWQKKSTPYQGIYVIVVCVHICHLNTSVCYTLFNVTLSVKLWSSYSQPVYNITSSCITTYLLAVFTTNIGYITYCSAWGNFLCRTWTNQYKLIQTAWKKWYLSIVIALILCVTELS